MFIILYRIEGGLSGMMDGLIREEYFYGYNIWWIQPQAFNSWKKIPDWLDEISRSVAEMFSELIESILD